MKLLAVLACAATLGSAQDKPEFNVRTNLVFLPTRVQKKSGETIYGLRPEQFLVEDNGVKQTVNVEEDPASLGVSLVVAVQCSRSAPAEFGKLKGLGAMIDSITGHAPHEVAVVSYGEGQYLLGDFTGSSDAVRHALSRIRPCGDFSAAAVDAVEYSIDLLKRRQNRNRRAILLIGETRDHGSHAKLHEVITQLGVSDTVIYTVAFSPLRDDFLSGLSNHSKEAPPPKGFTPPPLYPESAEKEPVYTDHTPLFVLPPQIMILVNALRSNTASELASLSGGEYMNFTTQKGFEESLLRISNQIYNYYLLSYKPPSSQGLSVHSVQVRVPDFPDAVIQTRRSYWAP